MVLGWLLCFPGWILGQEPQSWLATSVSQKLPHELDWTAQGQLRTLPGEFNLGEGMVDLGMGWSPDVLSRWSVDGMWRTGWDFPAEGGWTMGWRWATSVKWKTSFGDHDLRVRVRHQFGGPWMRPWDRARWRIQGKWTHDLPQGWKVIPSVETFLGPRFLSTELGARLEPMALRGRLLVDKKWTKRRHVVFGYQWQSELNSFPRWREHTLLVSLDLDLKKAKRRKKERAASD